jgi:uncharacterized protein
MEARKALLTGAGMISLGLGALGIVVPVLPTTSFVLLAAACFAKSSPRFYNALVVNRVFGPYINNYRNGTSVPKRLKIGTCAFLWLTLIVSAVLVHRLLVYGILAAVGVAVTWHVLSLKPRPVAAKELSV